MTSPTLGLSIVEGQPVVSSLNVAEHFRKQHKHVLDAIRDVMANAPDNFTGPNFRLSEYVDQTGRKLPAYNLTRDAFALVVMGFTGQKALTWKIRYIEAFNSMEANLRDATAESSRSRPIRVPAGKRPRSRAVFQDAELIDLLVQGHSQAQAARQLGVSETAVYKRLRRLEAEQVIQIVRTTATTAKATPAAVLPAPLERNLTCLDGELAGVHAMSRQLDAIAGALSPLTSTANADPGLRLLATTVHSLTCNASRHLLGIHQTLVLVRGAALAAYEAAATGPRVLTPEERAKKVRAGLIGAAKRRGER